jgi:hypothetical protein
MKGIIVFNVDVGAASLDTVEKIKKDKEKEYEHLFDKLKKDKYEAVIMTNRNGMNSVDKIVLD